MNDDQMETIRCGHRQPSMSNLGENPYINRSIKMSLTYCAVCAVRFSCGSVGESTTGLIKQTNASEFHKMSRIVLSYTVGKMCENCC